MGTFMVVFGAVTVVVVGYQVSCFFRHEAAKKEGVASLPPGCTEC